MKIEAKNRRIFQLENKSITLVIVEFALNLVFQNVLFLFH